MEFYTKDLPNKVKQLIAVTYDEKHRIERHFFIEEKEGGKVDLILRRIDDHQKRYDGDKYMWRKESPKG